VEQAVAAPAGGIEPVTSGLQIQPIARRHLTPTKRIGTEIVLAAVVLQAEVPSPPHDATRGVALLESAKLRHRRAPAYRPRQKLTRWRCPVAAGFRIALLIPATLVLVFRALFFAVLLFGLLLLAVLFFATPFLDLLFCGAAPVLADFDRETARPVVRGLGREPIPSFAPRVRAPPLPMPNSRTLYGPSLIFTSRAA
jgi:hypothetical protein